MLNSYDEIFKHPIFSGLAVQIIGTGIGTGIGMFPQLWALISSESILILSLLIVNTIFTVTITSHYKNKLSHYKNKEKNDIVENVDSDTWFKSIKDRLSDCAETKIYLKSFDSPENFEDKHSDILKKITNIFKTKIQNDQGIAILSFETEGSGFDHMRLELEQEDISLNKYIRILKEQEASNATTMYLFDNKYIMYNAKKNGTINYYIANYENCILYDLTKYGFNYLFDKNGDNPKI